LKSGQVYGGARYIFFYSWRLMMKFIHEERVGVKGSEVTAPSPQVVLLYGDLFCDPNFLLPES
jgi:hypothetical protein